MKTGTTGNPIEAIDWPDAFDICREADRPLMFKVGDEVAKCFPSGLQSPYTSKTMKNPDKLIEISDCQDYKDVCPSCGSEEGQMCSMDDGREVGNAIHASRFFDEAETAYTVLSGCFPATEEADSPIIENV